jgi:hypothetical protein
MVNEVHKVASNDHKRHKEMARAAIQNIQQICDDKSKIIEKRD